MYIQKEYGLNSESFTIIHVINKSGFGGIESLVSSLVRKQEKCPELNHIQFEIANNRMLKIFLKKSIAQPAIFFVRLPRLIQLCLDLRIRKKKNIFVFFHHVECHKFLAFSYLFLKLFSIPLIVYLHQSRSNLQSNQEQMTKLAIERSDLIVSYSNKVLEDWKIKYNFRHKTSSVVHNFVQHNRISFDERVIDLKKLRILYLGRNVRWKHPEIAIEIAMKMNNTSRCDIELTFAGINRTEGMKLLDNLPDIMTKKTLKFHFLGNIENPRTLFKNFDFLIYPLDASFSKESVGIACMESLCSGTPIAIFDKSMSDFNFPGIYQISDVLFSFSHNTLSDFRRTIFMHQNEIQVWRDYCSIDRYENDLIKILKNGF